MKLHKTLLAAAPLIALAILPAFGQDAAPAADAAAAAARGSCSRPTRATRPGC